jgi:hypothetical protein
VTDVATHHTDIDRLLREAATRIEWPPEPEVAARVRARLDAGPEVEPTPWARWWPVIARPAFAVTAVVVVLSAVLVASESARVAVADFLGLEGVKVQYTDKLPDDVGTVLILGERVTLAEAEDSASFDVLVPRGALASPDRVFFDDRIGDGQVSFVYASDKNLPPTETENVGLLVMQYEVTLQESYYKKLLTGVSTIEEVTVGSSFGFWVEGPHTIEYRDDGSVGLDQVRLAANTLIWEQDGVTIRLESALSKSEALSIAESMVAD